MRTARILNVEVELGGGIPSTADDYAREKVLDLVKFAPGVLRHATIRLKKVTRRPDAPVLAHVSLDVDGQPVISHAVGSAAHETVDLVQAKLRGQLSRMLRGGDRSRRERNRRQVVRRTHTRLTSPSSPVMAMSEMSELGYDFGLFTEKNSQQDSVIWCEPDGEYHLAQLAPMPGSHWPDVDVEPTPAPTMDDAEAIIRLTETQAPFMFYRDRATGRGQVLYHHCGNGYALIRA